MPQVIDTFSSDPSPPSGVRVSQNGLESVLVSWTPPSDVTVVTGYIISYQAHGGVRDSVLIAAGDISATVSRLSVGITYSISMASNSDFFISHETTSLEIVLGIYCTVRQYL